MVFSASSVSPEACRSFSAFVEAMISSSCSSERLLLKEASFSAVSLFIFSVSPFSGFMVMRTWWGFLMTYFRSRFSK